MKVVKETYIRTLKRINHSRVLNSKSKKIFEWFGDEQTWVDFNDIWAFENVVGHKEIIFFMKCIKEVDLGKKVDKLRKNI